MSIASSLHPLPYLRNPQETELGRRIVAESIRLLDELGLEDFTFKRLAVALGTAEPSVYRYFENKHRLLVYLVAWYWQWLEQWVTHELHNISQPDQRLRRALRAVVLAADASGPQIPPNLPALHRIVISEASKAYLTKSVDQENREGLFASYKSFCGSLAAIVLAVRPAYPYAHALVSTLLEASRKQVFFAQHLQSLTELKRKSGEADTDAILAFLEHLAFAALAQKTDTAPTSPQAL